MLYVSIVRIYIHVDGVDSEHRWWNFLLYPFTAHIHISGVFHNGISLDTRIFTENAAHT